ncbi:aldolase [Paenibacillus psychroresistens]|uniref:Aldolase n=1 Tax=Paenibacillus psychroresistens TaxID=1778678 RepID=A0A6B8RDU5_9BACL|nr:aldolase/citrate lyase family protein [Paenibacillus psychroresistens]QGQ94330.1 aldolase [Paenibacillus psychroresistens]
MNARELKTAMAAGKRVYGMLVVSPSPKWPLELQKLGMDFVFIDTEHIAIDRHQLSWMCHTFRALNIAPIVRIPAPDPYEATMVLDCGARGIIAPYVESVEQVQALRGAVKLRPLKGRKLENILNGTENLDGEFATYIQRNNEEHILIVNIESIPALDALDEILQVPGLDAVLIGPHDLSCSLGVPEQYTHPIFDGAVCTILSKARAAGVGAGLHYWKDMNQQVRWAKEFGLNLIVHKSDLTFVVEGYRNEVGILKGMLGDSSSSVQTSINI